MNIRIAPFGFYFLIDPSELPVEDPLRDIALRAEVECRDQHFKVKLVAFAHQGELKTSIAVFPDTLEEPGPDQVHRLHESRAGTGPSAISSFEEIRDAMTDARRPS